MLSLLVKLVLTVLTITIPIVIIILWLGVTDNTVAVVFLLSCGIAAFLTIIGVIVNIVAMVWGHTSIFHL